MKKVVGMRNIIIVVLCLTIICLGIGFIILSMELSGIKSGKNNYDLAFAEVNNISTVSGGSMSPTGDIKIKEKGRLLDMNFTLYSARDELDYNITIQNNGTISATILDLIESPEYANGNFKNSLLPITISYSDVSGKVLEPGDTTTLKLSVIYNYSTVTGVRSFNYKIGLLGK